MKILESNQIAEVSAGETIDKTYIDAVTYGSIGGAILGTLIGSRTSFTYTLIGTFLGGAAGFAVGMGTATIIAGAGGTSPNH